MFAGGFWEEDSKRRKVDSKSPKPESKDSKPDSKSSKPESKGSKVDSKSKSPFKKELWEETFNKMGANPG
ncbi:hypothetical protein BAVI_17362 [Neobacillus vireti LMG 21834]|uniref:Uncharacterized protein n=1 Tax=Neobacillus vireti LMG 21834 TaxID=1131730 RepID=A0AB94IK85_9BACI|nr:hypothetical protein BAVI_17362 [Neobacillus vireti LMG 21834]